MLILNIEQLFARTAQGIRPGLEVTEALLEAVGNPHRRLQCVHVAGTNGKGSVCAMIESVLRESGCKTGLYTSPHLLRFNERFRINGREIADKVLAPLLDEVESAAQRLTTRPPTFFEFSTVAAFLWFAREAVEYAVIETGMGGRWDSTNVIRPMLSVITRIDVDHTDYLGNSLEQIASEKAGIIKPGIPVICGPMPVEAEAVIYREAAEKGAPILGSSEAVWISCQEARRNDQLLDIEVGGHAYTQVRLPLAGEFQMENCAIAVAALEDLADLKGVRWRVKQGLESVRWPGRFQLLQDKPPILYDGAHNVCGARALFQTLKAAFPGFECGFVFGMMGDKDAQGILRELHPAVGSAWALTLPGGRAMSAEALVAAGRQAGLEIVAAENPGPALEWLEAGKKRLLCFTGSLYLPEELQKYGWFK
jgi:dihydrofolate synthase/folylpolyglutamate synthase